MQLTTASVGLISTANSPEDAARIFLGTVSQGLALVVADALSKGRSQYRHKRFNQHVYYWLGKPDWRTCNGVGLGQP